MTVFATDNFTDTDGVLLSAHTPDLGGPVTAFVANSGQIKSNELVSDGATLSRYFYAGTPDSADYSVQATMDVKSIVISDAIALHARLDPITQNTWYHLEWSQAFLAFRIVKNVAGTSTVLGTWSSTPSVGAHTIKLTVTGSGPVHLVATIDGVDRITVDDSTSPITAAGKVGLTTRLAAAAGTGIWLDSFSAGTVAATPVNSAAPTLTGTTRIGQQLSSSQGTWTDDGSGVKTYQWARSRDQSLWQPIAAATANTYELTSSEDGMFVRCDVTDTDGNGATTAHSAATAEVIANPSPGSRVFPAPPTPFLHFIGDLHCGQTSAVRTDKMIAGLASPMFPTPLAHIQVGDQTNLGTSAEDTIALALLARITDAPVYVAAGNHDLYNSSNSTNRTVAAWEAAYAAYLPGGVKNYTVDFSSMGVRVIVLGPDVATGDIMPVTQATLDWWAARLAETTLDCWTVFHLPLQATVLNSDATNYWSSDLFGIYALGPNGTDDTEIRAVLAAHTNAKAWIAGHTHSPITDTGFAALTLCGSRLVAAINTSSINWEGRNQDWNDPFHSIALSRPAGGGVEVRYFDHGAMCWTAPATSRVTTLMPS